MFQWSRISVIAFFSMATVSGSTTAPSFQAGAAGKLPQWSGGQFIFCTGWRRTEARAMPVHAVGSIGAVRAGVEVGSYCGLLACWGR
ncbi:hypothetical protein KRMM14A1259_48060 [Krasilnikovia sp. MM14-A1259]